MGMHEFMSHACMHAWMLTYVEVIVRARMCLCVIDCTCAQARALRVLLSVCFIFIGGNEYLASAHMQDFRKVDYTRRWQIDSRFGPPDIMIRPTPRSCLLCVELDNNHHDGVSSLMHVLLLQYHGHYNHHQPRC